jgi:hypothetical protein
MSPCGLWQLNHSSWSARQDTTWPNVKSLRLMPSATRRSWSSPRAGVSGWLSIDFFCGEDRTLDLGGGARRLNILGAGEGRPWYRISHRLDSWAHGRTRRDQGSSGSVIRNWSGGSQRWALVPWWIWYTVSHRLRPEALPPAMPVALAAIRRRFGSSPDPSV